MDGYRQFWNVLIFGNKEVGPHSLERYWCTMALVALIFFAIGVASGRIRPIAPVATAVLLGAYVIALAPFMLWTVSCSHCDGSFGGGDGDFARSSELLFVHLYWSPVFTMGVATLWIGALLSKGLAAMIGARPGPRPATTSEENAT